MYLGRAREERLPALPSNSPPNPLVYGPGEALPRPGHKFPQLKGLGRGFGGGGKGPLTLSPLPQQLSATMINLRRFLAPPERWAEGTVVLDREETHHLSRVLRLAVGARVVVCDGRGRAAVAVVGSRPRQGRSWPGGGGLRPGGIPSAGEPGAGPGQGAGHGTGGAPGHRDGGAAPLPVRFHLRGEMGPGAGGPAPRPLAAPSPGEFEILPAPVSPGDLARYRILRRY